MDTYLENAFYATSPDWEQIKFLCNARGLYVLAQVNQVKGFTERGVKQSKRAKKLYYNLDAPTMEELKFWVRSNQEKNVPVSCEDIKLLEQMEKRCSAGQR